MSFLDWAWRRKSSGERVEPALTSRDLVQMIGVEYGSYTNRPVTTLGAMQMTAVFGCVRVLAESVGMLPCMLMENTDKGKMPAVQERLYKLLSVAPNGYMTPQEFWELLISCLCLCLCLCLRGNFYAYKVKALGEVVELLPLDPFSVQPALDENWKPVYQVTFPDGSSDALTQDDIWHVRILTLDGLTGVNPIAFARHAIALAQATEEHGSRLFGNGAVTSGVLTTDQTLTAEAFSRLKAEFEQNHQGLENAHKPLILEMGLKWLQTGLSAEDAQFLETRKFQLEEICRIFRVPQHLVQNTDKSTYSNIENLGRGFINYSLIPYLTRIEQRIDNPIDVSGVANITFKSFDDAGSGIRLAMSPNSFVWYVWNGSAFVSIGSLTADSAGADILYNQGMTKAVYDAIPLADYEAFLADGERMFFAYGTNNPRAEIVEHRMVADSAAPFVPHTGGTLQLFSDRITYTANVAGDFLFVIST